jgi:hypothetical protein
VLKALLSCEIFLDIYSFGVGRFTALCRTFSTKSVDDRTTGIIVSGSLCYKFSTSYANSTYFWILIIPFLPLFCRVIFPVLYSYKYFIAILRENQIPVRARFSARPDWPWSPLSLPYNGYRVFHGGKVRPGRAADHSTPSSAEVLEE